MKNLMGFLVVSHRVWLLVSLLFLSCSGSTSAGILFASGDSSPVFFINTSNSTNTQFFENILAGGTKVVTHDINPNFVSNLNGFYNSLAGVSSSDIGTGTITPTVLVGADLFISFFFTSSILPSEINVLGNFLGAGGTVMLMADRAPGRATKVNAALAALGSGLSVPNIGTTFDTGTQIASGSKIAADPFTSGVTSLQWGSTHEIAGGTPLFFMNSVNLPFMAYESIVPTIPEPTTLAILGLGLAAIGLARRRRLTGGAL